MCYRPICDECREPTSAEPRCRRCFVIEILTELKEERAARAARKKGARPDDGDLFGSKARARTVVALIAALLVFQVIAMLPSLHLKGRTLYALDRPSREAPGLNGCLRRLWQIRRALDQHLVRHGRVPLTLAEVFDGTTPRCPTCRQPYRYERIDATHYMVRCPHPEEHLVDSVHVNSGSAPTILTHTRHR